MNFLIYGSAEIDSLIPPNSISFASISPIVRETDSFPGYTLSGPIKVSGISLSYFPFAILVIYVRYILPPFEKILYCSFTSVGR